MTERLVYRVPEVCKMLGISRATLYRRVKTGEIAILKLGGIALVKREALDRLIRDDQREMNVLDLFSGIGGFSLGLERAGMRTVAFCEIDPYCRAVLRKHWPDVPVFGDIRDLTAEQIMANAAWDVRAEQTEGWSEWQRTWPRRQSHRCHLRRLPLPGHFSRRQRRGHCRRAQRTMVGVRQNYWGSSTQLRHR